MPIGRKYIIHLLLSLFFGVLLIFAGYHFREYPKDIYFTLEAKVAEDDTFELFYQTENERNFVQAHSIQVSVTGEKRFQNIEYALPFSEKITRIRFDLGNKSKESDGVETILVKRIIIGNSRTNYVFSGDSLTSFFQPNYCIGKFTANGVITTKLFGEIYDPFITSGDITSIVDDLKEPVVSLALLSVMSILMVTISLFIFIYLPPLENYADFLKISFVLTFFIMTLVPVTSNLFNVTLSGKIQEKRTLAARPELEFSKAFARQFENYFTDNFGLREILIRWNSLIKVTVFQASINPEKAMIGRDQWIYYNNSRGEDYIFKSYTHLNLLTKEEVKEEVEILENRKKQCEKAGIKYIKAFCPQTQTIYPEYLPFLMKIQIRDTLSRPDQIIQYLKKTNSDFKLIDLRPALFAAKKDTQIYRKLDSHWNNYGAFIAYQALFNQCYDQLGIKPKSINDFKIQWLKNGGGDLADVLANTSTFVDMTPVFTLNVNEGGYKEVSTAGYPDRTVITVCETCADKRKVLIFRDSYSENLVQFISLHFHEVVYMWWGYKQSSVDFVKPDIIIEIPAERYF